MIPGLPVSPFPHCKNTHHDVACLQLFQAIELFKHIFNKAYQVSKMICKVRLLKSRIKTRLFLEETITSSNEVIICFESNLAVVNKKLGNPT
jgi:hypothetical protein